MLLSCNVDNVIRGSILGRDQDSGRNGNGASQLAIFGEDVGRTGECITYSLELQDDSNHPVVAAASILITLGDGLGTGNFYSDSSCTVMANSIQVLVGNSSQMVYYRSGSVENVDFLATSTGSTLQAGTHHLTIAPAFGSFAISGVSGGSDTVVDSWLFGDTAYPSVEWTPSTNALSYNVTIYEMDGITIKCATVNVSSGTQHTFSGCNLDNFTSYRVAIAAKDLNPGTLAASNNLFIFTRGYTSEIWSTLSVANDASDGSIYADAANSGVGLSPDHPWIGEWNSGFREYSYFNFTLPQALPSGTLVTDVTLKLHGRVGGSAWNSSADGFQVWLQNSSDAPLVSNIDMYPGDSGGTVLTSASVIWISGPGLGLGFDDSGWNISPNLESLLQEVISNQNGLNSGNHIQFWVSTNNIIGSERDVEVWDYIQGAIYAAQVSISIAVAKPESPVISGVTGGSDHFPDEFLLDGAIPSVQWATSLGAASYETSIYEDDGTTLACGPQVVEAPSLMMNMSAGCALSSGSYYRVHLVAKDSSGISQNASNDFFRFYVGAASVLAVYPINGAHWNQWIKRSNSGIDGLHQPDEACNAGERIMYGDCIHGADKKKYPTIEPSCNGMTITESLGVFNWNCDDSSGNAVFYSTGLADTKGLAQLVDGSGWKTNDVTVWKSSLPIVQSTPSVWWGNSVIQAPINDGASAVATLSSNPNAPLPPIYVVASSHGSNGYYLANPYSALVTVPGAVLNYAGSASDNCNWYYAVPTSPDAICLVFSDQDGVWLEGTYVGNGGANPASHGFVTANRFARYHNVNVSNSSYAGIYLTSGASGMFLDHVRASNNGGSGIENYYSSRWTLHDITATNNTDGVATDYGPYSIFSKLILVNNSDGLVAGENTTWTHVTATQNSGAGITSQWVNTGGIFIIQSISFDNGSDGVVSLNCSLDHVKANLLNDRGGTVILSVTDVTASLSGSTFGAVSTDDVANLSDINGSQSFASISDWLNFDSLFRAWGKIAGAGICSSGTCQIFDYRLLAAGSEALNTSGDGINPNSAFISGAICPSAVHGDQSITDAQGRVFLINALEILEDAIGNENGLCESGESCVYSPNFGAYQGDGDYRSSIPCVFQNGTISNVTMHAYPTNGL